MELRWKTKPEGSPTLISTAQSKRQVIQRRAGYSEVDRPGYSSWLHVILPWSSTTTATDYCITVNWKERLDRRQAHMSYLHTAVRKDLLALEEQYPSKAGSSSTEAGHQPAAAASSHGLVSFRQKPKDEPHCRNCLQSPSSFAASALHSLGAVDQALITCNATFASRHRSSTLQCSFPS